MNRLDATAAFARAYSDTERADLQDGWPTCRTYPRSLAQAFSDSRAPAIERPRPRDLVLEWGHRAVMAVCLVGGCVVLAVLLAERFAS
jgi:heme A synthase